MQNNNIILIPDVHGRTFWADAVRGREDERIIFLGDYIDPYTAYEGISANEALDGFRDIIELKKRHPCNITLLLGNHDMGYLDNGICITRRDWNNHQKIKSLLLDNISLFDICVREQIAGCDVLISHAGFHQDWIDRYREYFSENGFDPEVLNTMLHDESSRPMLYRMLSDTSRHRGGYDRAGSPIWADIHEFKFPDACPPDIFQIVGHTLQYDELPLRQNRVVCIDCRKAFEINDESFAQAFPRCCR